MSSEIERVPRQGEPGLPKERPGQPGGRRDTNRRERTTQLLKAALQLFLERGLDVTTIDDLTRAAGVSKGSFYRYFSSKPQLVETLFSPIRARLEEAFAAAGVKLQRATEPEAMNRAYVELGESLAEVVLPDLEVVQLYLQESRGPRTEARAPVRQIADLVAAGAIELTQKARTHGLLRPFPAEVSALTVVGAVERLLYGVLVEEAVQSPLELPEQLTSLVLDGLRTSS